jgi:hypothetical protein
VTGLTSATSPSSARLTRRDVAAAALICALFTLWGALGLRGSWFFYDEWSLIGVELRRPWTSEILLNFNGHLWAVPYLIYRIQLYGFGLNSHLFVEVVFVATLLALQLSIAAVLRAGGVGVATSLLAGGGLAYLSAGLQDSTFTAQIGNNLATACCLFAVALVLRRPATGRVAAGAGALLVLAAGCDSGTALPLVIFAAVVMALTWRSPYALAAAPALGVLVAWYATVPLGPTFPGSFGYRLVFAGNLLLTSLGALTGLPVAAQFLAGCAVLAGAVWLLARAWQRGRLTGERRTLLAGGLAATAVLIASIAQTRATLVGGNFTPFNRYLEQVDVPLVLATFPTAVVVVASNERLAGRLAVLRRAGPALAISALTLIGVLVLRPTLLDPFYEQNALVHHDALSAVAVIDRGCPSGTALHLPSWPALGYSPQMSTGLLRELIAHRYLSAPSRQVVDPAVSALMCAAA